MSGVVSKVERYGIFIKLSNSNISGLCHYSEVDDGKISAFSAGDLVKVIVLDIDAQKKRVSLGLKASYFEDEDMEEIQNESDAEMNDLAPETVEMEIDSDIEEVDNSRVDIDQLLKNAKPINMDSDEESEKAQSSESEEEQIQEPPRKKSRIEKEIEKNAAEKALVEKENLIASGDAAPETADDYERLIVGSPNSSFLWIKYMAFQFQAVDIAMSRKVAERALKTISFRDEKEKMNVWVAYLNLEHSYGTPDSLKEIFDRAVLGNEPKAIYLHLSNIYIRTEQKELVESLFEVMLKKFKQSSKIWTSAGLYYLKSGQVLEARKISERCLKSLPKHKRIFKFI